MSMFNFGVTDEISIVTPKGTSMFKSLTSLFIFMGFAWNQKETVYRDDIVEECA